MMVAVAMAAEVVQLEAETGDWMGETSKIYKICFTTARQGECFGTEFRGNGVDMDHAAFRYAKCNLVLKKLKGSKGEIADQTIFTQPGMICGGATEKENKCVESDLGWKPSADDMTAACCKCSAFVTGSGDDYSGFSKTDAAFRSPKNLQERRQCAYLAGADVGAITEVELSIAVDGDQTGAQWSMSGMSIQKTTIERVNNNWTVSPVKGNKVYISGGKVRSGANDDNKVLTAELSGTTTNGVREGALKAGGDCSANADCESGKCGNVDGTINPTLANGDSCEEKCLSADADAATAQDSNCMLPDGIAYITNCDGQVCEEEMNKRFGL
jgi:hypothetical protein